VAVAVAVFFMVKLVPGDPIVGAFGTDITPHQLATLRHEYGLDQDLAAQFVHYLAHTAQLQFGRSFQNSQPVGQIITQRLGVSLKLALGALIIVLGVGIPLGTLAAGLTYNGAHRRFEVAFTTIASVLGAIPDFLTATVLAFLFAVQLPIFPVAGNSGASSLVLPAIAVGFAPTMTLARVVRVESIRVLNEDYIRTARSQRLSRRRIYLRHVLPNSLTAALTIAGLVFASIIGSAVVVETVFNLPGLGSALVQAVLAKDYPVVQGITFVLAVAVVVVNAIVDVTLSLLDPRTLTRTA
jgi:peptide/nickel transport system permease protein